MSDSESEGEGNLVVVDDAAEDPGVDDSICPTCNGSTYVGETISCETCFYWFHFECVGVTQADACVQREDVPFFCQKCRKGSKKKGSAKSGGKKPKSAKKTPKSATKTPKNKKNTPAASTSLPTSPPIKLKISFGKKRKAEPVAEITTTSTPTSSPSVSSILSVGGNSPVSEERSTKRRKRLKSEDEEERWLDAVESGNLHAVDAELKSIRDPKLMTARQRAMVVRKTSDDFITDEEAGHMALAYTSSKKERASAVLDEEELKQKAIKSAKRKEIEQEKREQDKKKTMERLLNKKESSAVIKASLKATGTTPGKDSETKVAKVVYRDTKEGPSLTFPPNFSIPIPKLEPKIPPKAIKCAIETCMNIKRYNCSKTGKPLCSLQCYKKNLIEA